MADLQRKLRAFAYRQHASQGSCDVLTTTTLITVSRLQHNLELILILEIVGGI